jgi:hypothetical protein
MIAWHWLIPAYAAGAATILVLMVVLGRDT